MLSRKLCVHIETSSLWAEFVNKNMHQCSFSIRALIILVIHIIVSYFQNIDLLYERWIPCQASTSVLYLYYRLLPPPFQIIHTTQVAEVTLIGGSAVLCRSLSIEIYTWPWCFLKNRKEKKFLRSIQICHGSYFLKKKP